LKKFTIIFCLALISSVLVAGTSAHSVAVSSRTSAQDDRSFSHKDAGIEFTLPKGWKAKPDGEVITVSSADDAVQMVFWVPDADTFDAAVKELDKELSKTVKNTKITSKGKQDTHNGMSHYGESGTGEVEGATIAWSVDVLAAKKPVLILTFAAPELLEKNATELVKLIDSIKKSE
jgi:predicted Zn-dependent protease